MVLPVTHKELKEVIRGYWKSKISLFISGRFGIGKSAVCKDEAKVIAKEQGREFVEWNKLTESEKLALFDNPAKFSVYIDIRLSEYSPDDIKGLPMFLSNQRAIEFKIPLWALYLEHTDSDGFLIFDEINLSVPLVMSSVYKIVYDRVINQSRINKNWFIVMCGNTSEDKAYTYDIAPPLLDRCGQVELKIPVLENWVEWAISKHIDTRIIGFLNFKTSNLWKVDYKDNQKFTTPRGWERLDCLINDTPVSEEFELLCCSAIGEGIAREFIAFCKIQEKFKLDDLIKNPKGLKAVEDISVKYFLVSAVAEKYGDKKLDFAKLMEISRVLDEIKNAEFVALLWKMSRNYSKDFNKEFLNCKGNDDKLVEKYGKYII